LTPGGLGPQTGSGPRGSEGGEPDCCDPANPRPSGCVVAMASSRASGRTPPGVKTRCARPADLESSCAPGRTPAGMKTGRAAGPARSSEGCRPQTPGVPRADGAADREDDAADREDARKTPGVVTESAASTLRKPALAGVPCRAGSCLPPERGEPRPGGCGELVFREVRRPRAPLLGGGLPPAGGSPIMPAANAQPPGGPRPLPPTPRACGPGRAPSLSKGGP
jgi:hypothetical protein